MKIFSVLIRFKATKNEFYENIFGVNKALSNEFYENLLSVNKALQNNLK